MNKPYECDRCGKDCRYNPKLYKDFVLTDELLDLKSTYQIWNVRKICWNCTIVANSFVDYYGVKSEWDKAQLKEYLQSGIKARQTEINLYNQLMYAGYYNET